MTRKCECDVGYVKNVEADLRGTDLTDHRNSHNLLHMLAADHESGQQQGYRGLGMMSLFTAFRLDQYAKV